MLIAKIIATFYVLLGLFGLLFVSMPENYSDMFYEPGRPFVGLGRLVYAYIALILIAICGASVWFFPTYTKVLAISVLAILLTAKVVSVIYGRGIKCLPCFISGTAATILLTWALISTTH